MAEDGVAIINLATEGKVLNVAYGSEWTAEDLCIKVCKQIGISPVTRHLFALQNRTTRLWYPPDHALQSKEKLKFEFRLRFKPSSLGRLKQVDPKAYDYYFQQARADVLENKVSDIVYERHKSELMGLGVCDMYRVMLEKDLPRAIVESNYKKYIPKECRKRHAFFIKKPIHNALAGLSGHDAVYVKEQYLSQFESMAPNYLCEEYKALMDNISPGQTGHPPSRMLLRVCADDIKYCENETTVWKTLCALQDLCFITTRQDGEVQISRKNGIPMYLQFGSKAVMISFVSAVAGYYRLTMKWTFKVCSDVVTPSLEKLHKIKCHGPVGGEFSYGKMKEKRSNRPGTYILRESETKYNVFYLDSCGKDRKPRTHKIEQFGPDDFVLSESVERFRSIPQLIASYRNPEGQLYLAECLPPSDYDISPLLLCAPEGVCRDVRTDDEIVADLLGPGLRVIEPQALQVFKSEPLPKSREIADCRQVTTLYRAMWRVSEGTKLEVTIKVLNTEEGELVREFLDGVSKWGQLRSHALVRLYGLTVSPTFGKLMEFVKLGRLDVYLRKNPRTVKTVEMLEACTALASALYHLEQIGIVHGHIRCRKLLVHEHTTDRFTVKLADPGLSNYSSADVHWLPPECYPNPDRAKRSTPADVWAVTTTIWEIFSRGAVLPIPQDVESIKKFYASGRRLPIPKACPTEVYNLMIECWGVIGDRKHPQAMFRDISNLFNRVYDSRRKRAYATALPKRAQGRLLNEVEADEQNSLSDGESEASSHVTDRTSLPWDEGDESRTQLIGGSENYEEDLNKAISDYFGWIEENGGTVDAFGNGDTGTLGDRSIDSSIHGGLLGQMQGIYELCDNCNVILQGRIGQGFYGEVYRGTLEWDDSSRAEPQQVAVKKLKTRALEEDLRDFEREIAIMKTLKHPNVVEILGVISEPEICLVMEYVKHGSLQNYLAIHRESLTHKRLLGFALDIATGMEYLGRQNIVHRDLAARNILVADETRVKISDFGLAQVIGKNDYYILQTNRDLPIKWYAPESLSDGKFSSRSDVWSFGVTMYETFGLGEDPKLPGVGADSNNSNGVSEEESSAELLAAIQRGTRLPCPPTCPEAVYLKLMYPCWHLQSHQRPRFSTLCSAINDLIVEY